MIYQRALLKLLASGLLGSAGRQFLDTRVWTIESGEGTGLKLKRPQNVDYITGSSEPPVQSEVARHLGPGHVFYDIGTNIGFFSLIAARIVGRTGHVYSFEPVPENVAAIRTNVGLNGFANVSVFEVAVGERPRKEELLLTDWDGGAALSASVVKPASPRARVAVHVVALDDFVPSAGLQLPHFVKIDVEGVEVEVIRGMTGIIAEAKPLLLYEIDDSDANSFAQRWDDIDRLVSTLGYQISRLEDSYPDLSWNVGHSLAVPLSRACGDRM